MGMFQPIIFIYAKDGKIRVLSHGDALHGHSRLIGEGWKHTATIDPCRFLENLHNECDHIVKQVKELSKVI